MKNIMCAILVSMLTMVTAPAYAAEAWQVFDCELLNDKTEEDVLAAAKKWLKAAKTMKGGEGIKVSVHFPVAAASRPNDDFKFILKVPSFEAWGIFWDGYKGSAAHKVDQQTDAITVCPSSRLFEAAVIEAE